MAKDYIETKAYGTVVPTKSPNTRNLYEHQKKAIESLNTIDKNDNYSTLVVLPTGGGKTYTASIWRLANDLDKCKKILWIAHRQMLLEQAAESFQKYTYHFTDFVSENFKEKESQEKESADDIGVFDAEWFVSMYE